MKEKMNQLLEQFVLNSAKLKALWQQVMLCQEEGHPAWVYELRNELREKSRQLDEEINKLLGRDA